MSGVEPTSNTDWAAIIVAITAIIGLIITLLLHLHSASKDRNIRFNELLEKFSNELSAIRLREVSITTIEESLRYQKDFLHVMNRLAYLKKLKKIDNDMINFFEIDFIYAHTLVNWSRELYSKKKQTTVLWEYASWWIDQKKISAKKFDILPPKLFAMYTKAQEGYILVYLDGEASFSKTE